MLKNMWVHNRNAKICYLDMIDRQAQKTNMNEEVYIYI